MSAVRDVVVAGAGVVGAALAVALQRRGIDVVLVDKAAPPAAPRGDAFDLRVYALSPASMEFLRELGAWQRLPAGRVGSYGAMRVWSDLPARALGFAAADVRRSELGWIVEQDQLLWALQQCASTVERVAGAVASLDVTDAAATLTLDDGRTLSARLVVAADGADSPLRDRAGIDVVSWSYAQRAIVCHVSSTQPHHATALQRFLPTGPLAFLPLADGRSSIVWSTTDSERLLALDDAAFLAELEAASQSALGELVATTPRASFPLRLLHAQRYAVERVALAGDSAHVVHPLAGQGVNLGLADARALAQVLVPGADAGALRALKRYERARRGENLDMLAVTDGLYRAFGVAPLVDGVLAVGMAAIDVMGPAKRVLMQRALGLG